MKTSEKLLFPQLENEYLENILRQLVNKYNIIEIDGIDNVDFALAGFSNDKDKNISCRPEEILEGLYQAVQTNAKLKIGDAADPLTPADDKRSGLIVIENIPATSTVIAVNYALSVDADIKIVEPLGDR